MTSEALRKIGLAAGGGAFAIAALIAVVAREPQPSAQAAPLVTTAAFDGPAAAKPGAAAADLPNQNLTLLVRFKPGHPLAKAAARAAAGDVAGAEAMARRTLANRAELAGLCLDGFTLGGAEVVLRLCEPAPDRKLDSASRQWLRYLRSLPGVDYVDRNVTVKPVGSKP